MARQLKVVSPEGILQFVLNETTAKGNFCHAHGLRPAKYVIKAGTESNGWQLLENIKNCSTRRVRSSWSWANPSSSSTRAKPPAYVLGSPVMRRWRRRQRCDDDHETARTATPETVLRPCTVM